MTTYNSILGLYSVGSWADYCGPLEEIEVCSPLVENNLGIDQRQESLEGQSIVGRVSNTAEPLCARDLIPYKGHEALVEQMVALSDRVIRQVVNHTVGKASNTVEGLKATGGWCNVVNAFSYKVSALLSALYDAPGYVEDAKVAFFDTGLLGVESMVYGAIRAFMARGANCGPRSDLGIFFLAQQWELEDLKVRKVEIGGDITPDHALLELRLGHVRVYCDPWLGKTFVGDDAVVEVLDGIFDMELGYLKHIEEPTTSAREFCWAGMNDEVFEKHNSDYLSLYNDPEKLELDRDLFLEDRRQVVEEIYENADAFLDFQATEDSYTRDFVLSKENREDFLKVMELAYLFELRELYPSNPHINPKMNELFNWYIPRLQEAGISDEVIGELKADFREALGL